MCVTSFPRRGGQGHIRWAGLTLQLDLASWARGAVTSLHLQLPTGSGRPAYCAGDSGTALNLFILCPALQLGWSLEPKCMPAPPCSDLLHGSRCPQDEKAVLQNSRPRRVLEPPATPTMC